MIDAIDGRGLELAVAAARQAGIQRFLLVSAFPEASRGKEVSETFEHYMAVKKFTDVHLSESDLDWVILRPGTLLDVPGTGKVRTGLAIPYGDVPRDDVAATLLEIIEHPAVNRIIIELTEGETSVARSEEPTSELQSLMSNSYAVFCLQKKNKQNLLRYIRNGHSNNPHT